MRRAAKAWSANLTSGGLLYDHHMTLANTALDANQRPPPLAAYLWEEISDESPYRDPPGRFHRARSYARLHSAGLGAIENDIQALRRSSARFPDGGRGREHRQE